MDVVGKIKEAILGKPEPTSSITFYKQADGRTRVLMRVSNNFKDRHGEIITEEAHREYESYVATEKSYPEFQLWHTAGSKWGQADLVSYDDGFLTVCGLVDQGKEYIAEGLAAQQKDLGVSHGFQGWGTGDGLIHWYRMKECSPLPRQEAANTLTSMEILEKDKGMNDKKKKFFTDVGVPTAVVEEWDKQNKDIDAVAKAAGFEFKEVEPPPAPEPAPVPATPPAPEPKPEPDVKVEVTLPDGSKAMVLTSAVKAATPAQAVVPNGSTPQDMPSWAKELVESNKALQTELSELKSAKTVDSWEAAIVNGKGFVASKEGSPPSASEEKENGDWLAELIVGGAK